MGKYIKGKDGKMAGSIGDGKTKIPTPAPDSLTAKVDAVIEKVSTLNDMLERYAAQNPAGTCIRCESDSDELSDDGYCGGCFDDIEEGRREPMTEDELNTVGVIVMNEPMPTTTPWNKNRTVRITYEPDTARYKCEFLHDGNLQLSKYLTNIEVDGLEMVYDLSKPTLEVNAFEFRNAVEEDIAFDTDGWPTNLDDMLGEFMTEPETEPGH
jgi:hypothetical protein